MCPHIFEIACLCLSALVTSSSSSSSPSPFSSSVLLFWRQFVFLPIFSFFCICSLSSSSSCMHFLCFLFFFFFFFFFFCVNSCFFSSSCLSFPPLSYLLSDAPAVPIVQSIVLPSPIRLFDRLFGCSVCSFSFVCSAFGDRQIGNGEDPEQTTIFSLKIVLL